MCKACNHIATYQQLRQADPTKTSVLRANFVKDMNRRFNKIKKLIYAAVVTNDVFGLNPKIQVNEGLPTKVFQFTTNPEKVERFMSWLNRQVEQELLTVEFRSQLGQASQAPWTNMYISDSYKRGVDRAAYEAKKGKVPGAKTVAERGGIEAVMGTPLHMDRLGMLYTRTFTELKGITAAMDTQISKVLAQGIADGDSPATIARKLNKVIGGGLDLTIKTKAGIERTIPAQVRARTLARTEVIRAHHAATIQEYRNFGLAGVKVQAEWSTAGFNVCDECASLEGKIYTLDEIEGLIPKHPNCRCIALPILDGSTPVEQSVAIASPEWQDFTKADFQGTNLLYNDMNPLMKQSNISYIQTYNGVTPVTIKQMNVICETISDDILRVLPEVKNAISDKSPVHFILENTIFTDAKKSLAHYKPDIREIAFGTKSVKLKEWTKPLKGKWVTNNNLRSYAAHEYGHYVQYQLPIAKQKEWQAFYNTKGAAFFKKELSVYGSSNWQESFAEAFSYYVNPKYKDNPLTKEIQDKLESIIGKRIDL